MSTYLAILNTLWMVEQQSQEEELCYRLWRNSPSEHFADPGKTQHAEKKLKQICRNLDYFSLSKSKETYVFPVPKPFKHLKKLHIKFWLDLQSHSFFQCVQRSRPVLR